MDYIDTPSPTLAGFKTFVKATPLPGLSDEEAEWLFNYLQHCYDNWGDVQEARITYEQAAASGW